ncbi:MFS transporter [Cupriavidus alkaliphilus]|uniref:AAHS family benzoate transporter-like MFS transporter n=1 Tax=Cupriavidus alkaliphilus TaxID=942866 RepID=A0A7W4VAB7_9BURK|nr:MFS transporter [Cupriavidus alkaliphilus]MBB3007539.1 AAHS family benzoate transporter-like MFS transporter [Cupriavidus alkaliphilus]PVY70476.1 AAHS family benzoate transporter-like MFS transporter [Cupriavidus alkaliphilus]
MRQIDVHQLADTARFNRFHALILFWCALIIIFDGYDLAVAGIALPSIMKEMGVTATSAGFMVSSALFGMMFGAIFLGTVADRIGRRRAIAICVALFSVFTAAAGLTSDPVSFSVTRFLAGLGIGGVMPNVVAQMTEYSPRKLRGTLVTLMFSGYSVGGMLAALLGKGLIESYGWQSVFLAAGLPVVLIPLVLRALPESMPYLIRTGQTAALQSVVSRLAPSHRPQAGDVFVLPADEGAAGAAASAPIRRLFQDGRGVSTVMFWVAFFMCLFMVYALSSWLTKLMAGAGYSLGSALTFVLVLNFGAMLGAIGGGWLADRLPIKHVLIGMYTLAAVSITLLGYPMPSAALFVVVGLAGASTIGTQIVTYAYAGQFYPMAVRGTGIGWASGVGRSGAILAPIVIGVLVGMSLPLQQNFMAMAIPAVIAVGAVSMINHRRSASAQAEAAAAPVRAVVREA